MQFTRLTTYLFLASLLFTTSCEEQSSKGKDKADLILYNGTIMTMNDSLDQVSAIAIRDGRILALGDSLSLSEFIDGDTQKKDLNGAFTIPGLIEGHGHFLALGKSLINLNFLQSPNWQEIEKMVIEQSKNREPGEWIEGRGWHQEKWNIVPLNHHEGYPTHNALSSQTSKTPTILYHASGHSLFANEAAMKAAGVAKDTPDPPGGKIVRDKNGEAIGVFEERAMDMIVYAHQKHLGGLSDDIKEARWQKAIDLAQELCIQKGITSFQDAGSKFLDLERYKARAEAGNLKLRLWAMLRHSADEIASTAGKYRVVDAGDGYFSCTAIKTELDGALGSYGAWLIEPYDDKPGFYGQNTTSLKEVDKIAKIAHDNNMQLCVHAIGDRANHETLNIMETYTEEDKDLRWRIEHAQHLDTTDIPRFADLGVIASYQAIHCTSDAPFVIKRLGYERAKYGAYAWRTLWDSGAIVTNGTDAPVEYVDPLLSYYASVTRKRSDYDLSFFPEQSLTRLEGLKAYTINNAYAAFQEEEKGSLEIGKYADITVLSENLLTCKDERLLDTEVLMTIINGKVMFENN